MVLSHEWISNLHPLGHQGLEACLQRHASYPDLVVAAVGEIGESAVAWAVEATQRIIDRLRERGALVGVPSGTTGSAAQGCESGLLTALISIRRGHVDAALLETPAMLDIAGIAFRHSMPLEVLIHRVWASHAASQDEMLAMIQRHVPVAEQLTCIQHMNAVMFDYGNSYVRVLTRAYESERRTWKGRLPQETLQVMRDIAEGRPYPANADQVLGVSLRRGHLQAMGWSDHTDFVEDREMHLKRWGQEVASSLCAQRLVMVNDGEYTRFWWNFDGPVPANAIDQIRAMPRPEWLGLAIGPAGTDIEGFRDSFFGAQLVTVLRSHGTHEMILDYQEVSLVAQLLQNRVEAERFVRVELGELNRSGERYEEIRETLRLYLRTGNGRAEAAKALHISPTTVAYRVKQAEQILGRPPSARSRDLGLALELRKWMSLKRQPAEGVG